ncbi:MAG: YwqG family protein [Verrucomicrobiales bacterium]|nr:YwqG family protein [Verrucomicrobiales bacterium]
MFKYILIALVLVIALMGLYAWPKREKQALEAAEKREADNAGSSGATKEAVLKKMSPTWEKTRLPAIKVETRPSRETALTESKFFGRSFYLPKGKSFPKDKKDRPMALLAQINFAESPPLEGYPQSGLLQIFISAHDDHYGSHFEGFSEGFDFASQNGYEVRFYPEIDTDEANLETDFTFLPHPGNETGDMVLLPGEVECGLKFSRMDHLATPSDYRFKRYFPSEFFDQFPGLDRYEAMDAAYESQETFGHQIGGYASFTQTDPRSYAAPDKDWKLLLQIDSDNESKIMWGDVGIANFFITPGDLAKRDFSKVIYNWDCH